MSVDRYRAWNNFVLGSDPSSPGIDENKRDAAIANLFMGGANNGGINSFLTSAFELDGQEVVVALARIGATSAAEQVRTVLAGLGEPLCKSSAETRLDALSRLWTDDLDELDTLSAGADEELLRALECHVQDNAAFYLRPDAYAPNDN